MMTYAYRAVHATGRVQRGRMQAANENELAFFLREIDLELIEAKLHRPALSRPARVRVKDQCAVCSQLATMLGAGVPLDQALTHMIDSMPLGAARDRLIGVAQNIKAGDRLSQAFERVRDFFDPVALAVLRAGETSGNLAATFATLAKQMQWEESIRVQIRRALRYPLFLLVVAFLVTSFMMILVVPQIVAFLTNLGTELPLMTRILIGVADFFAAAWWGLPLLALGAWFAMKSLRANSAAARSRTDGWLLRLPILGGVLRKLALTRFTASLAVLLDSGLTLPESLGIATGTLGNAALRDLAAQTHTQLVQGKAFSLAAAGLYPLNILHMLKVAEKAGILAPTLHAIAQSTETEARDGIAAFLGLLEPVLTLLVGGLLAWVVLAVLGPVYGALEPLSRGM